MKNLPIENYILIFTNIEYFLNFVGISSGFWLLSMLGKMIMYDINYYNGAGEDFLMEGKEVMERNYYTRLILGIPKKVNTRNYGNEDYFFFTIRNISIGNEGKF